MGCDMKKMYSVLVHTDDGENEVACVEATSDNQAVDYVMDTYDNHARAQLVMPGNRTLEEMQAVLRQQSGIKDEASA